jgi:glycosyltransferase involved in cell wall biosynthesis
MKLKFIYWFAFYNINSPTVRYRGSFPLIFFKENYGINSYLILPSYHLSMVLRFFRAYFSALFFRKKDSIIVIQSVYKNAFYSAALKLLVKLRNKHTFYDMDDADYLRYPPELIYHFINKCSAVTVGSSELLKNISKHNKNTFLITCPTTDLKIVKQGKNKVLTLGWIGDFAKVHKESMLNSFFPALVDLPFNIKLILMGVCRKEEHEFLTGYFKHFPSIEVEMPFNIDWLDEVGIQQKIATFDIGIATLLDTEFARSKSAFKLKQCLNNGVPVLSSNIAENNLFLDHGKNGYLCDTLADFRQRIIEFNEMGEAEYRVFSDNARKAIHRFDLKNFCDNLIKVAERE